MVRKSRLHRTFAYIRRDMTGSSFDGTDVWTTSSSILLLVL